MAEIFQRSMLGPGRYSAATAVLAIIITIISATVNSQMVTASSLIALSSSLSEGQQVCPGDTITFTCVTNGSSILAWSSDDYIGQAIQLEFASFHEPGRIARNRASPIGTQAVLVSKEIEENETLGILESQLSIVVTSDYQTATIKCLHVDTGSEETTGFQLLDGPYSKQNEPGAPEEVKVFEIPDDRRSRGICVLTLQLSHPSDVALDEIPHLSYFVYYHGQQREVITAATSNIFVVQNCTPDLLINVTAVNRCGNMGGSVIGIAPEFLSVTEVPTVTVAPNHANAGLIAGITVVFIIIVISIIAIIIFSIKFKSESKRGLSAHLDNEAGNLESGNEAKKFTPTLKSTQTCGPDLKSGLVSDEVNLITKLTHLEEMQKELQEELNNVRSLIYRQLPRFSHSTTV